MSGRCAWLMPVTAGYAGTGTMPSRLGVEPMARVDGPVPGTVRTNLPRTGAGYRRARI